MFIYYVFELRSYLLIKCSTSAFSSTTVRSASSARLLALTSSFASSCTKISNSRKPLGVHNVVVEKPVTLLEMVEHVLRELGELYAMFGIELSRDHLLRSDERSIVTVVHQLVV